MDAGLLVKFFGTDSAWKGPCVVILDAEATVTVTGQDSIVTGGVKMYAPRLTSGRIAADAVCLLPNQSTLLVVQQLVNRQQTGEEQKRQILTVVDTKHIVALEFADLSPLELLGVPEPFIAPSKEFRPGTLVG